MYGGGIKEGENAHLLCRFCSLALLLKLRIDSLLLLLHKLCLPKWSNLSPTSRHGELANFVNSKFLVCLHFELAGFLQCLLLDERNLNDTSQCEVTTLVRRNARESTILFISLSTSSSFSGLDAIAEEWEE